ncbi:MAG: spore germination protein [Lachnospira sp.]
MSDFSTDVEQNIKRLESTLRIESNFDILTRKVKIAGKTAGFFFIDGFVQEDMVEKLMQFFYSLKEDDLKDIDTFLEHGMPYTEIEKNENLNQVITKFLSGMTILTIEGFDECILIDCRTYPMRNVSEPWKDRVLRGSRDGFVETLVANAALLRRRIRDPRFSMVMYGIGERSKSDVAVCYIDDKVDRKLLNYLDGLLKSIQVEALTMNIESLAECMFKHKWINPFPKFKYSERPDTATAAIMDGNIVIMVDNSPAVMIIPASIFDIIEEPDDYSFSPGIGTYLRFSRFFFTLITLFMTPLWLLLVEHPDWVPEWLKFITISDDITVPVVLQLLILELAVDGLKLAAVNTPNMLSTPLSIVAGIVVGEYAVSSGWFNSESLLYMAVVTVGTYSQTSYEMGYALKFLRVCLLLLTQFLALPGFIIGTVFAIFTICFNKTLSGHSYIYPLIPFDAEMLKRKVLRVRLPHSYK